MQFYITVALLLWALALVALCRPSLAKGCGLGALVVFIACAGLRFETGFDWLAYERYFNAVSGKLDCYKGPQMEPAFWLLNTVIYQLGGSLQTLFLLVAAFNGVIFYQFCRRFNALVAPAMASYFCWMYLPLQMGAMRQSLAVSCFMMAMLAFEQRKHPKTAAWVALSIAFQASTVLFTTLLLTKLWKLIWKYLNYILAGLMAYMLIFPSPAHMILQFLADADIPFFSVKIADYLNPLLFKAHVPAAIGYLAFNIAFLGWARNWAKLEESDRFLLYPLILMLLPEAILHDFPYLWTRLQALAIPCQIVFAIRYLLTKQHAKRIVQLGMVACIAMSAGALAYRLNRPFMTIYYPYQSMLEVYITGEKPTLGRQHTLELYQHSYEAAMEAIAGYPDELRRAHIPLTCKTLNPTTLWEKLVQPSSV